MADGVLKNNITRVTSGYIISNVGFDLVQYVYEFTDAKKPVIKKLIIKPKKDLNVTINEKDEVLITSEYGIELTDLNILRFVTQDFGIKFYFIAYF